MFFEYLYLNLLPIDSFLVSLIFVISQHDVLNLEKSLTVPLLSLKLQFDVTFPALPCSIVSLDAMDISGEQHLDVVSSSK